MAKSVIITCAVTGSVHTPSMSPYLPITPSEIAVHAIEAAEAGASILHLHARDPKDGRPSPDPEVFGQFLPRIKQSCDAVVNITTGGGATMTVEERMHAALVHSPEMCSLNMGTMNFALFPAVDRIKEFKYDWEKPFLEGTKEFIFKNTFQDIETALDRLGNGHGVRFEFECYDVGHLYTLKHFVDRALIKPPFLIQFVLGVLGGIGAETRNLVFMKETADHLFGSDYEFSVLGAGRMQMPLAGVALSMGGNVRVGLEDSLSIGPGKLAERNADQVRQVRQIAEGMGLSIASPAEARERLALKGGDAVGF